jgi:hypothetical protein
MSDKVILTGLTIVAALFLGVIAKLAHKPTNKSDFTCFTPMGVFQVPAAQAHREGDLVILETMDSTIELHTANCIGTYSISK